MDAKQENVKREVPDTRSNRKKKHEAVDSNKQDSPPRPEQRETVDSKSPVQVSPPSAGLKAIKASPVDISRNLRKKPSFSDKQAMIKVLVGFECTPFYIYESYACYHSRLLARMVADSKATGRNHDGQITIDLPDATHNLFGYFQNWIYTKRLHDGPSSEPKAHLGPNEYLQLHFMGEYLESSGFTNAAIERQIDQSELFDYLNAVDCWKKSAPDSSLRKLVCDLIATPTAMDEFEGYIDKLPLEMIKGIAVALKKKFEVKFREQALDPGDYYLEED